MDFKDDIIKLSERIKVQRDAVKTEEATKTSFIMPMIYMLGYDIFDPYEVIPEMDCDLTKRGDKIDYAIQKDGKTILLIECKQSTVNLNLHDTQLAKYYAASNARFGILTNGIEYRFYADLDKNNIMDDKPFLVVDMLNLTDEALEQLKKFHKSNFNEGDILSTAQDLKYSTEIRNAIKEELANPSWDFVRYFAKKTYQWSFGQKAYEQFSVIVKDGFESVINDIIKDRLQKASRPESVQTNIQESSDGVVTTEEELEAFGIVKDILKSGIDINNITYKDYKSYFVVAILNKWYWICRLKFGKTKKSISFPLKDYKGESSVEINDLNDIYNHKDKFLEALGTAKTFYNKYNKESILQ